MTLHRSIHAQPWDDGGTTSAHRCGALCRRNHRQKTQGNTHLVSHPDGSATWITSSGHSYHRPAVDHCPEHTAHRKAIRDNADQGAADLPNSDTPSVIAGTGDGDGDAGPPDGDIAASTHVAGHSATAAHDNSANDVPSEDPDSDTSSGNDPPPF